VNQNEGEGKSGNHCGGNVSASKLIRHLAKGTRRAVGPEARESMDRNVVALGLASRLLLTR
jgi:hypothetical protein